MNTQAYSFYNFQKPQDTYTLEQFVNCQSNESICYNNLSFIDEYSNIQFDTYNIVSDYLDEIRDNYCVTVTLTNEQLLKYRYKPNLLCYDVYSDGELAFLILLINDMYSFKSFTKKKLLMPTKVNMKNLTKYLYNSNKEAISIYNEKNKH